MPPPPGRPPGLRWLEPRLRSATRAHPGHQVPARPLPGPRARDCSPRAPYLAAPRSPELPRRSLVSGSQGPNRPWCDVSTRGSDWSGTGGKCEGRAVGDGATPSAVALSRWRSRWRTPPASALSSQPEGRRPARPGQPGTPEEESHAAGTGQGRGGRRGIPVTLQPRQED